MNKHINDNPIEFIQWMVETIHKQHHSGKLDECNMGICTTAKRWVENFHKDEKNAQNS